VAVAERQLRLLMGLPLSGGELLRPITEPPSAEVLYDAVVSVDKALQTRPELRAQQLHIHRRRLELIADRNFLLPELDLVARYRLRGLGDDLYYPISPDNPDFGGNNTHEWQVGAEYSMPLGFRQAHAAVRNSQLRLAREQAVLSEMKRQIVHDLENALVNKDRAYEVIQVALNRQNAALQRLSALTDPEILQARRPDYNLIMDAQRRLLEAEVNYHRARVDYAVAIKNVQFELGSLLNYCNVQLVGEPYPSVLPVEQLPVAVETPLKKS
jgi:outer membrane protein TolC